MDFQVLEADQIKDVAENELKARAKQRALEAYQKDVEVKRLTKVVDTVPDEFKPNVEAALETATTEADNAGRKADRAAQSVKLSDAEAKAAKVDWLRQWLVQLEGEYVSHQSQAAERQRILETQELTDDERATIGRNWQANMIAMESLDQSHDLCLAEMVDLGIDPKSAKSAVPNAPSAVDSGFLPPPPEPPAPKKAASKTTTKAG